MNFSKKDILIGFVLIAVIILGSLFYKKIRSTKVSSSPLPVSIEFKEEIENRFKYDIPDDVNTIELKDVSGGNARAIATSKEILADIDDPAASYFYEGWLQKDDSYVPLGKFKMAKGGWLLEYDGSQYSDYKKIIVSLEKVNDSKIEKKILEGSFN